MSNTTISSDPKKNAKERLQKIQQEESRKVKGIFKCYECPGTVATFSVKKYRNEPTMTYTLKDGEEYTLPLWVARHLNGIDATAAEINGKIHSCGNPVHAHQIDPKTGESSILIGTVTRRYGFQSLDYMAI